MCAFPQKALLACYDCDVLINIFERPRFRFRSHYGSARLHRLFKRTPHFRRCHMSQLLF